jgi:hypothetical protein
LDVRILGKTAQGISGLKLLKISGVKIGLNKHIQGRILFVGSDSSGNGKQVGYNL